MRSTRGAKLLLMYPTPPENFFTPPDYSLDFTMDLFYVANFYTFHGNCTKNIRHTVLIITMISILLEVQIFLLAEVSVLNPSKTKKNSKKNRNNTVIPGGKFHNICKICRNHITECTPLLV